MNFRLLPRLAPLAAAAMLAAPAALATGDEPTPEQTFERMTVKLWRGVINVATSPIEVPKQLYTTTRDMGVPGPFVGVFKGAFMTLYRAVGGAVEAATFPAPVPGDYAPMLEPAYIWQGWGPKPSPRTEPLTIPEAVHAERKAEAAAEPPADTEGPNSFYYIISKGDTVESIADSFALPAEAILKANPGLRKDTQLTPDTQINIPIQETEEVELQPGTISSNYFEHSVSEGETLENIAATYGITKEAILKANPELRKDTKLANNLVIKIPVPESNGPQEAPAPAPVPMPEPAPAPAPMLEPTPAAADQ